MNRRLYLGFWFPHIPLAIGVGLLGLLELVPPLEKTLGLNLFSTAIDNVSKDIIGITMRGVPHVAIGFFLLVMSGGLLVRSRLAWVTTLFMIVAGLGLTLYKPGTDTHQVLRVYNVVLLASLVLTFRHFNKSSIATGTLFALTSVMLLVGYAVIGSYLLGQSFSPPIQDIVGALYFAIETISTVGYGDITPNSHEARLFLISIIILSIIVFTTAISATIVPVIISRIEDLTLGRHSKMARNGHYIIVGNTALANNTSQELITRGEAVTFIVRRPPEGSQFDGADVVVGDGSDLDTLRLADAEHAKAILALLNDDSENAFVILAAKELKGTAKTVAAVNDAKNLKRIRRVRPDMVIAPQVLGGELLAMALSGEAVDSEKLMRNLLDIGR